MPDGYYNNEANEGQSQPTAEEGNGTMMLEQMLQMNTNPRKIAITGAGGTGKSTLAKALAKELKLPYRESPSRACFEKHGVLTEDDQLRMSAEQRLALQMDIFEAISMQVDTSTEGVFDRTPLDNLFYALFRCHDSLTTEQFEAMEITCFHGMQSFDLILYAPIYQWGGVINDGMRTQSMAARQLMDHFIRSWCNRHDITTFGLPDCSPAWRVVAVKEIMQGKYNHAR